MDREKKASEIELSLLIGMWKTIRQDVLVSQRSCVVFPPPVWNAKWTSPQERFMCESANEKHDNIGDMCTIVLLVFVSARYLWKKN